MAGNDCRYFPYSQQREEEEEEEVSIVNKIRRHINETYPLLRALIQARDAGENPTSIIYKHRDILAGYYNHRLPDHGRESTIVRAQNLEAGGLWKDWFVG
jgi:hypothetical protein